MARGHAWGGHRICPAVGWEVTVRCPVSCRLTKPLSFADCVGDELPWGWEAGFDPQIGVYYIDHVNSKCPFREKRPRGKVLPPSEPAEGAVHRGLCVPAHPPRLVCSRTSTWGFGACV